jgi:hypothetical protein
MFFPVVVIRLMLFGLSASGLYGHVKVGIRGGGGYRLFLPHVVVEEGSSRASHFFLLH